MYLLVIGLVAVIVAFLVAAFFSMRRGHDDEDEPARRPSVRDRIRGRGGDARDRDPRWDSAAPQRSSARRPGGRGPAPSRRPSRDTRDADRADRYDRAGYEQPRGYEPSSRGYGERAPIRGYDGQRSERAPSARRGGRNDDATETVVQSVARPARARPATPARRPGDDSFGTGPVTALYDTGPSAAAVGDYATAQVNADPDLTDSDVFPRVRADIPQPASKARPRSQPKTRGSRPSRSKHDDDDDWPSTEWDQLSDEQYWAELSADKPLSTTARSAQSNGAQSSSAQSSSARASSARASGSAAAKPGRSAAARPAGTPRPDRDRPAASADHTASRQSRDRAGQEDATQQLSTRPGSRSSARQPAARARGAQAPGAADRDARAASSRAGRPAPGHGYEATGRIPSRGRSQAGADVPASAVGTGPMSAPPMSAPPMNSAPMNSAPMNSAPMNTGPMSAVPMSTGPATGPTGLADAAPRRSAPRGPAGDDPLTSPSYARSSSPAGDSRAYRSSGRAAQRDPARGGADDSRGYPRSPARGDYPAAPAPYDSYPAAADGRRDYPAAADGGRDYPGTASRHGYPASPGERTDPNVGRPAAPAGYPASPPPARPAYDDTRPAETTSPQAGAGNPYGSFVDSAPPPQPENTGPTYPPAAPAGNGQGGYSGAPASGYPASSGYPDPYRPGRDGYPAAASPGSQDPGTGYHPAPPPPAAYPYPAGTGGYPDSPGYQNGAGFPASSPYQNGSGYRDSNEYLGSNGYSAGNGQHARPDQAGYGSRYAEDGQQNPRYPAGPGTDPYGPDGYGGYHSRQG